MTRRAFEIPLSAKAQSFFVSLGGVRYFTTWRYNAESACWMLSIADSGKTPILSNIPVVTGLDLLAPYRHTGIAGSLIVQTDHNPDAVPTFENFGGDGKVYYITTE